MSAEVHEEGVAVKTTVPMRRILSVLVAALVLYVAFAFWSDIRKVRIGLSHFHWEAFVFACALAFGNYLLRFFKWEFYLAQLQIRGIKKIDSLLIFFSGFILTVSPGKVGEVFKSVVLGETYGIPAAKTAPIIVAERVTDLIGIIVLILFGSIGFSGGLLPAAVGGGLVVSLLVVIASRKLSLALIGMFTRALPKRFSTVGEKLTVAYESLSVLLTPRNLIVPTLLSISAWSLECLALWVILRGFGEGISISLASFIYATSTLIGAVMPGGLGVTEASLKEQLVHLGRVSSEASTPATLAIRFATLWFAVLVGFISIALLKKRFPTLLKR